MDRPSLGKLFDRLVHRSFNDIGLIDGAVRDYVADLLVRFARTDALYRIHDPVGQKVETVVELLIEVDRVRSCDADREETLQRHTGDYAMFMSGVFRDYVERHGFLGWHLEAGQHAYQRMGKLRDRSGQPGGGLYRKMAASFEMISGGLDYMRKVYFGRSVPGQLSHLVARFQTWN